MINLSYPVLFNVLSSFIFCLGQDGGPVWGIQGGRRLEIVIYFLRHMTSSTHVVDLHENTIETVVYPLLL